MLSKISSIQHKGAPTDTQGANISVSRASTCSSVVSSILPSRFTSWLFVDSPDLIQNDVAGLSFEANRHACRVGPSLG